MKQSNYSTLCSKATRKTLRRKATGSLLSRGIDVRENRVLSKDSGHVNVFPLCESQSFQLFPRQLSTLNWVACNCLCLTVRVTSGSPVHREQDLGLWLMEENEAHKTGNLFESFYPTDNKEYLIFFCQRNNMSQVSYEEEKCMTFCVKSK